MLTDELTRLRSLAAEGNFYQFREECFRIRKAWQAAAFSDAGSEALRRYFRFHLKTLSELSFVNLSDGMQGEWMGLISALDQHYPVFFDHDVIAPEFFIKRCVSEYAGPHDILAQNLANGQWSRSLRECLIDYLGRVRSAKAMTYGAIGYYRYFLNSLAEVHCERLMHVRLFEMNFNHLGYFACMQEILHKVTDLRESLADHASRPVRSDHIYQPGWPALKTMACGWLEEAVKLSEKPGRPAPKLSLNLSVSHLAFLTRLFQEEGLLGDTPLNFIFKFLSTNYSTKRQAQISAASLSKEYYSTDQHAAARVRGLLQNMLMRINRTYFPILAFMAAVVHANS